MGYLKRLLKFGAIEKLPYYTDHAMNALGIQWQRKAEIYWRLNASI